MVKLNIRRIRTLIVVLATGLFAVGTVRSTLAADYRFFDFQVAQAAFAAPPEPEAPNPVPDAWTDGEWDHAQHGVYPPHESVAPVCEVCGDSPNTPASWSWYNGSRIWSHNRPRRATLSVDQNDRKVLSTKSFNLDVAAGYETRVRHFLGTDIGNHNHFVEFVYWGLNEWKDSRIAEGQMLDYGTEEAPLTGGSLFTQFNLLDFDFATYQQIMYQSNVHNFELNLLLEPRGGKDRMAMLPNGRWQRRCQEGVYWSWLFGFRGLSLDEGFIFDSAGSLTSDEETTPLSGRAAYRTHNDMFGVQAGATLTVRKHRLRWGATVKAAPMINWSDQFTDIFTLQSADYQGYAANDGAAFMGEVNFFADYRLSPRITVRAGYDLAWLVGVALAPEQVDYRLPELPSVNDNGRVFFQGLTLGFDAQW